MMSFQIAKSLKSVTIPNSVTTISSQLFSNCINLTSVTIPNSLTRIGEYAFSNCSSLISVRIPKTATYIGARAFQNYNSLKEVYSYSEVPPTCESDAFTHCNNSACTLYVPMNCTEKYRITQGWDKLYHVVEMKNSRIEDILGDDCNEVGSTRFRV